MDHLSCTSCSTSSTSSTMLIVCGRSCSRRAPRRVPCLSFLRCCILLALPRNGLVGPTLARAARRRSLSFVACVAACLCLSLAGADVERESQSRTRTFLLPSSLAPFQPISLTKSTFHPLRITKRRGRQRELPSTSSSATSSKPPPPRSSLRTCACSFFVSPPPFSFPHLFLGGSLVARQPCIQSLLSFSPEWTPIS